MAGPNFYRFNWWDVGITLVAIPLFLTFASWVMSLVIDRQLAPVRVDFARLETSLGLKADQLEGAFEAQKVEVNQIVKAGLDARTDEVARGLLAAKDKQQWFYVQIANVPSDSQTFADLNGWPRTSTNRR